MDLKNLSDDELLKVYQQAQIEVRSSNRAKLYKQFPDLRGDSWYLPKFEDVNENNADEEEKSCFSYSFNEIGIKFNLFGIKHVYSIHPASLLLRIIFLALLWLICWLALPDRSLSEPKGAIFDPASTFVICFFVGGIIGRILGIPPLLFVFLMGILWGNVQDGNLVAGISRAFRTFVSRAALTVILLRSGLAMSWKTIQPAAVNIITMSIFPLLIEVIVHGFVAKALLDYGDSSIWPFVQSMTASPSASAVVGATVLDMRARGYGIRRGPGVLLVPSVILDFTLGIWGINFVVELLFNSDASGGALAWQIIKGPLQMVLGVICGIILGYIWVYCVLNVLFAESKAGSFKNDETMKGLILTRVSWHSLFVLCLMGGVCVFLGYEYQFAGGGCLACAFLAATAQHLTTKEDEIVEKKDDDKEEEEMKKENTTSNNSEVVNIANNNEPTNGAAAASNAQQESKLKIIPGSPLHHKIVKNFLSEQLARVWDWVFMPALFAFSGSAISVSTMFAGDFVGKALACLFIGATARILICTICTWTFPMTKSERIISMIASAGRGSAQVALGSYALTRVQEQKAAATPAELLANGNFEDDLNYGTQVYDCAELGVIVLGTMSIILISRIGPFFWLTDDDYEKKEMEKEEKKNNKNEEDEVEKKE